MGVRRSQDWNSGFTVYLLGWPGWLGGASTKLAHLVKLLGRTVDLVVVPNDPAELSHAEWADYIHRSGARCLPYERLPRRLRGYGVALCNFEILTHPRWNELRQRGLHMVWSNEMMWTYPAELGAVTLGQVDTLLYVSHAQRVRLEPAYQRALTGSILPAADEPLLSQSQGRLRGAAGQVLRWWVTGNYIDPADFPFVRRERPTRGRRPFVIGRLSRPDPDKYPEDFPEFYEGLGLRSARFRVMGWSDELTRRWKDHRFDGRWDLLAPMAESPARFLQSLDLFVYSLGTRFRESWGRVVVEAMLTGAVPLLPRGGGHHLENLIRHGENGFLCADADEFGLRARQLERDHRLRERFSLAARRWAASCLCRADRHRAAWMRVFTQENED